MSEEEYLTRSIQDLKAEIGLLSRTMTDIRYEDFKRVVLTQIQFTSSKYYEDSLREGIERMDCMSDCSFRTQCKAKLREMFDGINHDFLRDDFESSISTLKMVENIVGGEDSRCGSAECKVHTLRMIGDLKMLVKLAERIRDNVAGEELGILEGGIIESAGRSPEEASRLISPLSHPARIRILRELEPGGLAFSDLSRRLEMRTGHLQFHLRPLLDEEYVKKIRNRGDYSITQRGKLALDFVDMLSRRIGK